MIAAGLLSLTQSGPRCGGQSVLRQTTGRLLDHLVGDGVHPGLDAEGSRRLNVDDELGFGSTAVPAGPRASRPLRLIKNAYQHLGES